jgi:acetylornithine deacetylase/succinyl-diaminopimelate desuccinylase-like protein
VVHQEKYVGREIAGDEMERGATSAHVIVRLPRPDQDFDDGVYRCAFELVHPITRISVQRFLNRQIRREGHWLFDVVSSNKGKKPKVTEYKYHPKLDLVADVGRKIGHFGADGRALTHIVFTKRSERQSIAQKTSVIHEDVYADVELRVSARQAPDDPDEKRTWVEKLKDIYQKRGYETKLYYRHAGGGTLAGNVHRDIASAADLVMCPKEIISLSKPPKQWSARTNSEVVQLLKAILKKDALWESAASS